jgi:hypothetical protein
LKTPKFSKHFLYDYAMLFLRKLGFSTTEFYFRYFVMQKLKSIIKSVIFSYNEFLDKKMDEYFGGDSNA